MADRTPGSLKMALANCGCASNANSSSTALSECSMLRSPDLAWPRYPKTWHGLISPRAVSSGRLRIGALPVRAIPSAARAAANPRQRSRCQSIRSATGGETDRSATDRIGGHMAGGWWCRQSRANPSPLNFPVMLGKYREILRFPPIQGCQPQHKRLILLELFHKFPTQQNRELETGIREITRESIAPAPGQ
jgi:hypothetical protein